MIKKDKRKLFKKPNLNIALFEMITGAVHIKLYEDLVQEHLLLNYLLKKFNNRLDKHIE